ncbi:alpha/beta hydrolase [Enterococcus sp. OL5]|uniref:alpha/beta hydrolase n=1 Tax=Enterococcus sp. OL5 TaxID=2590214 RepID=UPI00112D5F2C|nr:alpha/beta hydrolase-fold protein [Enterococcus sp. OL5]TPR58264.1 alpha/beta hydrolase [Enterococcus sp. OL5]
MEYHFTEIQTYKVSIVLPRGYHVDQHYPTVYMQDDGNGAKQVLNYIDHLTATGQISPFILVGIAPVNRNDDYTPWPADALLPHTPKLAGKVKEYLTILATEIKPYIDTHYATDPLAVSTTIGGCSYGGLAALFASYYFPEVFGNYILLSASFWFEDVIPYLEGKTIVKDQMVYKKPKIKRSMHKLYGYVGEIEGIYRQGRQQQMTTLSKKAFGLLQEEGFPKEQMRIETCQEGTHDAYFFSAHFLHAIKWLFRRNMKGETYEHLLDNH